MGKPPIANSVPAGVTARPPGSTALFAPVWPDGSDASAGGAPALQLGLKVSSWLQPATVTRARKKATRRIAPTIPPRSGSWSALKKV